jgi:large subunit ribosomal protein L22
MKKQATAQLNKLRISPRKVRMVADVIRGKNVEEARNILRFTIKRAVVPMRKLLDSAVANAKHNLKMEEDKLFIQEIRVDEGRTLKRFRPVARGRTNPIAKRTSRITIILQEYGS